MNNGEILHDEHVGSNIATIKNGSQQHTNAPVIIANVLAALRSRFDSADCWVFLRMSVGGRIIELHCDGYATDSSAVGGSFSIRSTPLPWLHFSGLVLADDTFVKAVVVSLIVGKGRPMTATTAAAMPPEPPAAVAMSPACCCCTPDTFHRKPIGVSARHEAFAKGSGWV